MRIFLPFVAAILFPPKLLGTLFCLQPGRVFQPCHFKNRKAVNLFGRRKKAQNVPASAERCCWVDTLPVLEHYWSPDFKSDILRGNSLYLMYSHLPLQRISHLRPGIKRPYPQNALVFYHTFSEIARTFLKKFVKNTDFFNL